MFRLFLYILLVFINITGFGQNLCFKNYSTHNGLPSSQVYNIFQDANGDIWFATDRGISKYNGYQFENYDFQDGITNSVVLKFYPQKNGKVWCSTVDNSWFYFDNGKSNFTKYIFSDTIKKYSLNLLPDDLFIDEQGKIHVAFENNGNILIMSKHGRILQKPVKYSSNYDTLHAVHIQYDLNQCFTYFSTTGEIDRSLLNYEAIIQTAPYFEVGYKKGVIVNNTAVFSTGSSLKVQNKNSSKQWTFDRTIIGLGQFDTAHFWVGFLNGGVKIFSNKGIEKFHFLKNNSVSFLFKDQQKGFWISTLDRGVFHAQSLQLKRYLEDDLTYVYNISPGKEDNIVVSAINGEIYYGNAFNLSKVDSLKQPAAVKAFFETGSGSISPGYYEFDNMFKKTWIGDVSENRKKPQLLAYPGGVLYSSQNKMKKVEADEIIKCVSWAKNGFFFGTYSGVFYYDTLAKNRIKLAVPELDIRVYDIKLADKLHYFATSGNGLVQYNEQTKTVVKLTTDDGLASNLINEVFPENDSVVWLATNQGLNKVSFFKTKTVIETISINDGLPDNDITDVYVHKNDVWIGTRSGLCHLDKTDMKKEVNDFELHLFWEHFRVDSSELELASEIELNATSKNFIFEYHTAYFGNQKNLSFRYKLEGFDDRWYYTSDHKIEFNGLLPGEYNLIVQASAEKSVWENNQLSLPFSIYPPFYKTWWFIAVVILLVILIIYLFFKYRVLIYNRDLVRELLRVLVRKFKPKSNSFLISTQGKQIRIVSDDVLYVNSEGNYLEIHTREKKHVIRCKIGEFIDMVPDKLEYYRVHRSYIVRLDKVTGKNLKEIYLGEITIPIGKIYKDELKKLEI